MTQEQNYRSKNAAENFGEMIKAFGEAISEIFNDPELKEKAKEFGKSAAKSAETFGNRFQDEDVRAKYRDVGKAAQDFGKSVADYFKSNKNEKARRVIMSLIPAFEIGVWNTCLLIKGVIGLMTTKHVRY